MPFLLYLFFTGNSPQEFIIDMIIIFVIVSSIIAVALLILTVKDLINKKI